MADKQRKIYKVESLNRAQNILSAFTHETPSLKLTEIVAKTGLTNSTAYRMLTTLCANRMCILDEDTGRYHLGPEILRLADICRREINHYSLAIPYMTQLRDISGETVMLSIRDGDFRISIDQVESLKPLRRTLEPGGRAPLYASAASKVFLASMSDEDIADYLDRVGLLKIQENTIVDRDRLILEIEEIRTSGLASSASEFNPGSYSIAAPVTNCRGQTVFVLSIGFVLSRLTDEGERQSREALLKTCRELSERLGARQ